MSAPDKKPAGPAPDTPPPKRRFWQVHLSTAVVMTLAASGFVFMNCSPAVSLVVRSVRHITFVSGWHETRYGWPTALLISRRAFSAETRNLQKDETSAPTWQNQVFSAIDRHDIKPGSPEYSIQTPGLAIDVALLLSGIALAAFVCEYMIRRSKP
jgi:hypothetical protein